MERESERETERKREKERRWVSQKNHDERQG